MKSVTLTLLLVSLAVSGCGMARTEAGGTEAPAGGGAPPVTGPGDSDVMTPGGGGDRDGGAGHPQRVRPRPGMADVHPIAWESARQMPGGRALKVTYWTGVEPCNVLDHVDVRYRSREITLTLYEGHDPDEADTACIEVAVQRVVEVRLDEPVQGRKIVDGAD